MKIKSYIKNGSMVTYTTDEGEFAYPEDRFDSVEELEEEITKKIKWYNVKLKPKKDKKEKFFKDLNAKVK